LDLRLSLLSFPGKILSFLPLKNFLTFLPEIVFLDWDVSILTGVPALTLPYGFLRKKFSYLSSSFLDHHDFVAVDTMPLHHSVDSYC